jgi:hypothetical protein
MERHHPLASPLSALFPDGGSVYLGCQPSVRDKLIAAVDVSTSTA